MFSFLFLIIYYNTVSHLQIFSFILKWNVFTFLTLPSPTVIFYLKCNEKLHLKGHK